MTNELFFNLICTPRICIPELLNIISNSDQIILTIKYEPNNDDFFIIIQGFKVKEENEKLILFDVYNLKTPKLPTSTISSEVVAIKAANAQKNIDLWIETLKTSIQYTISHCLNKKISIKIENTCIYGPLMFWYEYDNDDLNRNIKMTNLPQNINNTIYYHAHDYIKKNHPKTYKKIKQEYELYHWIEK